MTEFLAALPGETGSVAEALHYHAGRPDTPFRRLPMPAAALVVALDEPGQWRAPGGAWRSFPRIALLGPQAAWHEARPERGAGRTLVALLPPWVEPAAAGAVVDLERERSDWSRNLLSSMAGARTPEARLAVLGEALPFRRRPSPDVAAFLAATRETSGDLRIGSPDGSDRVFRRRFRTATGVPPKFWAQLERFAANLRRLHGCPWDDRPADPAYADQAHEIREFRRFAGVTPGAYRRAKAAAGPSLFALDLS